MKKLFDEETLIHAVFSAPVKKDGPSRVDIRPVMAKGQRLFQITEQIGSQAFHRNLNSVDCDLLIIQELIPAFQQAIVFTTREDLHLTIRNGKINQRHQPPSKQPNPKTTHNRQKNYLVGQNIPVPYLVALGIMNAQGHVYPQKMPKYRQINRFLEMVRDTLPHLETGKTLRVIDFGCGKAYLTFALYDYLKRTCGLDVQMLGLDLKDTVIQSR